MYPTSDENSINSFHTIDNTLFVAYKKLGQGGFGVVKKARRVSKTSPNLELSPTKRIIKTQFRRDIAEKESNLINMLGFESLFSCESDENGHKKCFLTSPFLGKNLHDHLISTIKYMTVLDQIELAIKIVSSVINFHEKTGHAHNDIKPLNIAVKKNGEVNLIDFGSAQPVGIKLTFPGTEGYCAPEQELIKKQSAAAASFYLSGFNTDVYSLGKTLSALFGFVYLNGDSEIEMFRLLGKYSDDIEEQKDDCEQIKRRIARGEKIEPLKIEYENELQQLIENYKKIKLQQNHEDPIKQVLYNNIQQQSLQPRLESLILKMTKLTRGERIGLKSVLDELMNIKTLLESNVSLSSGDESDTFSIGRGSHLSRPSHASILDILAFQAHAYNPEGECANPQAAFFPAPMAKITVAAPVTISPPA